MKNKQTPLHSLHLAWGGKMVDFAGYDLPLSYAQGGLLAEHHHTRKVASLFDVSHMGQVEIPATEVSRLSAIIPADIGAIAPGTSKYTMITNDKGGIIDDCIVSNDGDDSYFIVLNASRKECDLENINALLPDSKVFEIMDRALMAIQGPEALEIVSSLFPEAEKLGFMRSAWLTWENCKCRISRCGYTGEDGFEISVPAKQAVSLGEQLMKAGNLKPAGLGARDSLRLEAGLCLYGNDLDEMTSPIEAGLLWTIPKSRRQNDSNYRGVSVIAEQILNGPPRRFIGLLPQGKTPVRRGAPLLVEGEKVGEVTSGVYSPTLERPIALGYVKSEFAKNESLTAEVRGKMINCELTKIPFVPHRYVR